MSKIIIFDMDGVLIDSEPVWQQVECEFYLRHYNISLGPKDFDLFTGMPVGIFLRKLHENHGLPSNNLPQIQDTIVAQVAEKYVNNRNLSRVSLSYLIIYSGGER